MNPERNSQEIPNFEKSSLSYPGTFTIFDNKQEDTYVSQEFKDYLKAFGIVQQLTPPYTPQHNDVFKMRNHTLLDMIQSMMNLTTLPLSFWDYALESATRIFNMVLTKKVKEKQEKDKIESKPDKNEKPPEFPAIEDNPISGHPYPSNQVQILSLIPLELIPAINSEKGGDSKLINTHRINRRRK
nr:retrovirus-related Pol polyprotein from transposon TNT 1-94 [Tanacetum cinerariifolium]